MHIQGMTDPDLTFGNLERVENNGKVQYILRKKDPSDIVANYALEDQEIFSYIK